MENLNLLFNKTYYEKIGTDCFADDIQRKNRQLYAVNFCRQDYQASPLKDRPGYQCFFMKTSYPGLLVGTGYAHGSGKEDEDIKLGFSFDYTTGQPYIPGSTVKGVLKSAFRHPEVICELCSGIPDESAVALLSQDIFDGNRDVFLDAVVFRGDKSGRILGPDNITPHKEATKNPVPLLLIKILPDVYLEFRFLLGDSVINTGDNSSVTLSAEEKKSLFLSILQLFGIGAKTNVGYGALEFIEETTAAARAFGTQTESEIPADNEEQSAAKGQIRRPVDRSAHPAGDTHGLFVGETVDGVVTGVQPYGAFVKIGGTNKSGLVHIKEIANKFVSDINDYLSVGDHVRVKIIGIKDDGKISLSIKQVSGND